MSQQNPSGRPETPSFENPLLPDLTFAPPPENAERELKRAYNRLMESGAVWFWQREKIPLIHLHSLAPEWPARLYRTAVSLFHLGDRLEAERWARACRHYATALWHEAKLSWLKDPDAPRDLAELPHAQTEYHLHESTESTRDLIQDLEPRTIPTPSGEHPGAYAAPWISSMIRVARMHLEKTGSPAQPESLEQCEHLKAAEEWARSAEGILTALQPGQVKPTPLTPREAA